MLGRLPARIQTRARRFTAASETFLPPPVWSLMRPQDTPTAGGIDRDHRGRAVKRSNAQGKLPTPLYRTRPPMPSPPRKCLVASTRPGHIKPHAGRIWKVYSQGHQRRSSPVAHICPVPTSSHKATAAVHLSFNGRRPPDAPLIPAAIDCDPALLFPASFCVCCSSLCHMSKVWRTTCLSLRACSLGWSSLSGLRTWSRGSSR